MSIVSAISCPASVALTESGHLLHQACHSCIPRDKSTHHASSSHSSNLILIPTLRTFRALHPRHLPSIPTLHIPLPPLLSHPLPISTLPIRQSPILPPFLLIRTPLPPTLLPRLNPRPRPLPQLQLLEPIPQQPPRRLAILRPTPRLLALDHYARG